MIRVPSTSNPHFEDKPEPRLGDFKHPSGWARSTQDRVSCRIGSRLVGQNDSCGFRFQPRPFEGDRVASRS